MIDYNSIITCLHPQELALLDKKIQPGMFSKLTWASEGVQEYFVKVFREHVIKLCKNPTCRLHGENCRAISECLQVRHEEKRLYEGNEFEVEQWQ